MTTFTSSYTFTQLVPSTDGTRGGPADWTAQSPFGNATQAGKAATSALVALRKGVSSFLSSWPVDGITRVLTTNDESPTRLPRVVDL